MVNPQTKKELQELIARYLAGKTSPEETRFVDLYYAYKEGKEPAAADNPGDVGDRLLDRINQGIAEQEKVIPITGARRWRWVAAAASIVLIGAGVYSYYHWTTGKMPEVAQVQQPRDVAPGHAGAVLTLADGREITLDSTHNGTIANQGKTQLTKDGARLQYQGAPGETAEILYNTVTTPRGRRYQLVLSDGTKVWLNAASSIRFPTAFTGTERRVTITGEAYLEVAKNVSQPFVAETSHGDVQVLGTTFDVMDYPDEQDSRTTLLEGSVKVGPDVLKPGEQAVVSRLGTVHVVPETDVQRVVAWKDNLFIFSSDDIRVIMRQLARWYNVDVEYQGDLLDKHFSGIISRDNNISEVLKMLESTEKIKFRITGTKVIVMP